MSYKFRIKYGDTTLVDNLDLESAYTKTLDCSGKVMGGAISVESYDDGTLPSGYTKLQYIQSGSSQYIDPGITITSDSSVIEFEILWTRIGGTYGTPCGNAYNGSRSGGLYNQNSSQTAVTVGDNNYCLTTAPTSSITSWKVNINGSAKTVSLSVDGGTATTQTYSGSLVNGKPVLLFCGWCDSSVSQYVNIKCQEYRYVLNGVTLRDLIACKNSSNTAGMYDLVSESFYTSPNGTAFTAGPVIS